MKKEIVKALNGDNGLPKGVSCVLICKIIMVTYGCIIAFDSKVRDVWRSFDYDMPSNSKKDFLSEKVLGDLYDYVDYNRQRLLDLKSDNNYSVFKNLDMILWEYGKELEKA